jgi:hypothetical protein
MTFAFAASGHAAVQLIELSIVKRRVEIPPPKGTGRSPGTIRVNQGDTVEIVWSSDEPATLHLHGYNVETLLLPGGKASMRFLARAAGRFAVETHAIGNEKKRHLTLVYIEVHPR